MNNVIARILENLSVHDEVIIYVNSPMQRDSVIVAIEDAITNNDGRCLLVHSHVAQTIKVYRLGGTSFYAAILIKTSTQPIYDLRGM
jgi:hypothetical protein